MYNYVFCIIILECVIQSSMFYSFYMFLAILLWNLDSALVSDLNAYIWISNCIQMFELYSNIRIYTRMLKECVFSTCSWKKNIWNRKEISLLLLYPFYTLKFRFLLERGLVNGGVCAEHDVTLEGSRQQRWQSVVVGGRWVIKRGSFSVI